MLRFFIVILSVIMLGVFILSVIMLGVVILCVIMLNAVMLSVVAPATGRQARRGRHWQAGVSHEVIL